MGCLLEAVVRASARKGVGGGWGCAGAFAPGGDAQPVWMRQIEMPKQSSPRRRSPRLDHQGFFERWKDQAPPRSMPPANRVRNARNTAHTSRSRRGRVRSQLASSAAPASPDFSGWNWVDED